MARVLTALPVYNEKSTVNQVLDEVIRFSPDVLVVDDGSNDGTSALLSRRSDIQIVLHRENRGYGAALISAFDFAIRNNYDSLVTIDCDGQHQPSLIGDFVEQLENTGCDIVSGSRYLKTFDGDSTPPIERRRINQQIAEILNARFELKLTDAFCGFKAYRVETLRRFCLTETGYAMPLQLWVQAATMKMIITELAVPLVYLDETRSFGAGLDDGDKRLKYYLDVIERSLAALPCGC